MAADTGRLSGYRGCRCARPCAGEAWQDAIAGGGKSSNYDAAWISTSGGFVTMPELRRIDRGHAVLRQLREEAALSVGSDIKN